MKKFIIMGLTIFAFALVGCNGDDTDDDDEGDDPVVVTHTVTNTTDTAVAVSSGDASASVEKDNCVSVTAEQWAALNVDGVCDNSDKAGETETEEEKANNCPEAGDYNVAVKADASGNELTADETAGEDCAELKAEEADAGCY